MNGIDKARFGAFVAQLRREKGMTQKDLAQVLYVSDKAVSKWERGLSLPDVELLLPLGEALGVTVTELLEGRRLERTESMDPGETEALVQKALGYAGAPARGGPDRKKWALRYFLCLPIALGEMGALIYRMFRLPEQWITYHPAALMTALSLGFGAYFCLFARTRMPWFYDVEKIGFFYDGPMRMNVPGVQFNNRNWPHILRWLRVWCLLTMTMSAPMCFAAAWLLGPGPVAAWLPMGFLAGLLAAIYVPGRKYV